MALGGGRHTYQVQRQVSVWRSLALTSLRALCVTQEPPCHLPSSTAWEHRDWSTCTAHTRKEGWFSPPESVFFLQMFCFGDSDFHLLWVSHQAHSRAGDHCQKRQTELRCFTCFQLCSCFHGTPVKLQYHPDKSWHKCYTIRYCLHFFWQNIFYSHSPESQHRKPGIVLERIVRNRFVSYSLEKAWAT